MEDSSISESESFTSSSLSKSLNKPIKVELDYSNNQPEINDDQPIFA